MASVTVDAFFSLSPMVFSSTATDPATPLTPGRVIEFEVPDMYGRPWAQTWEKYWEEGMKRPAEEDLFDFSKEPR